MQRVSNVFMIVIIFGLLIIAIFFLSHINLPFPLHDYLEYWSAGRLNLHGLNPYDANLLLVEQNSAGWTLNRPLMMWNPPWILAILMPFSLLVYSQSRLLWFFVSVSIIVIATNQSWRLYRGSPKNYWIGLLVSFLFTSTFFTLLLGQSSPMILIGVIGFLYFIEKNQSSWIAGSFVAFITIKPQLLYLFLIAFLLWCIKNKSWKVLIGFVAAIAASLLIASLLNPVLLLEYIQALLAYPPYNFATPTLGFILRAIFGYEKVWLQYVPPFLGIMWLVVYWLKKQSNWVWREEAPILMFVSIITSSYTWNHDQLILIPALAQTSILLLSTGSYWKKILIPLVFLVINIANFMIHQRLDESWTVWIGPALFGMYLIARKNPTPLPNEANLLTYP